MSGEEPKNEETVAEGEPQETQQPTQEQEGGEAEKEEGELDEESGAKTHHPLQSNWSVQYLLRCLSSTG